MLSFPIQLSNSFSPVTGLFLNVGALAMRLHPQKALMGAHLHQQNHQVWNTKTEKYQLLSSLQLELSNTSPSQSWRSQSMNAPTITQTFPSNYRPSSLNVKWPVQPISSPRARPSLPLDTPPPSQSWILLPEQCARRSAHFSLSPSGRNSNSRNSWPNLPLCPT